MNRGANPKQNTSKRDTPEAIWQEFIQVQLKNDSTIGTVFQAASFADLSDKILTLRVPDEAAKKAAQAKVDKLKAKLPFQLSCNRINIEVGVVLQSTSSTTASRTHLNQRSSSTCGKPLQAMNHADFGQGRREEEQLVQPILSIAVKAEQQCKSIYQHLSRRTELLAGGAENILRVSFNWRLRVGGTRGFDDRLLPAFHPVFGIPYVPASTLKGAARAWARRQNAKDIETILGMLEGKTAKAAKVEFLDAFPSSPCLDVDVATPQWHWKGQENQLQVSYQPTPFPMLSLKQPTLLIGLRPTKPEYAHYVPIVRDWLENALKCGIGSRVSSGYGRSLGQIAHLPYSQVHQFELWTQGTYGSEPPSKENQWTGELEFRPTAIRGILRYWFRSIALSLYRPSECQTLENRIFGTLGQQGKVGVSVRFNDATRSIAPFDYTGSIYLEAVDQAHLTLMNELLIFAFHLGGVGRGSRRPLHELEVNRKKMMRGCDWSVDVEGFPLPCDAGQWRSLINRLHNALRAVQQSTGNYLSDPGEPVARKQDVLDANAQILLLQSTDLIQPSNKVRDWSDVNPRGAALNLMYANESFKGCKNKPGERVGGSLGTPSFVWINSIFPEGKTSYQSVTILALLGLW
jgi:CRISPR-associated protein Cmr6